MNFDFEISRDDYIITDKQERRTAALEQSGARPS